MKERKERIAGRWAWLHFGMDIPPPPGGSVCAGMIGLTGEGSVSVGMIGVREETWAARKEESLIVGGGCVGDEQAFEKFMGVSWSDVERSWERTDCRVEIGKWPEWRHGIWGRRRTQ